MGPPPPGKSQMAIGFLRNAGTDHLEKQWDLSIQYKLAVVAEAVPFN